MPPTSFSAWPVIVAISATGQLVSACRVTDVQRRPWKIGSLIYAAAIAVDQLDLRGAGINLAF